MSKRFTDTDIWQKEWFIKYSLKQKVLLRFLFDNCDAAGVYEPNWTLLNVYIGENVSEQDILGLNQDKIQVVKLDNGNYFVVDFIKFQYGELSKDCKPHQPVFKSLEKNNIDLDEIYKGINTLSKGYSKGINTLQDKDKYKYNNKYNNIILNLGDTRARDAIDAEKKKSSVFIPPTVEEVSAYCKERNNGVVAERFVDFYACKGWMVGKNKMKDWRAAVRNWEKSTEKPKEHEIGDWL